MASLVDSANVYATCLRILEARGYRLSVDVGSYEDETSGIWCYRAEQDGFDFWADDPIALLGLVTIYEEKKPTADVPYWWYVSGPDVEEALLSDALEKSFFELLERDPSRWQVEVASAMRRVAQHGELTLEDALGISPTGLERAQQHALWPVISDQP